MLERLDVWRKTRVGYAVFAAVELLLSYLVASLALDSGNLWEWLVAIILLLGSLQNLVMFGLTFRRRG